MASWPITMLDSCRVRRNDAEQQAAPAAEVVASNPFATAGVGLTSALPPGAGAGRDFVGFPVSARLLAAALLAHGHPRKPLRGQAFREVDACGLDEHMDQQRAQDQKIGRRKR